MTNVLKFFGCYINAIYFSYALNIFKKRTDIFFSFL